jgi:hypothetical protein
MGKLSPGSEQVATVNVEILALEDLVRSYRLVRAHEHREFAGRLWLLQRETITSRGWRSEWVARLTYRDLRNRWAAETHASSLCATRWRASECRSEQSNRPEP